MNHKEIEFRSSQALREELSQALKNPSLQMALEIIKSSPDEFPPQIPGIHYDLILSRAHAHSVGTNNAIKRLIDLTKPIQDAGTFADDSTRQEWMDNIPQEMREALEKIQNQ